MIQHAPKPPEPSSFRGFEHYDTMTLIEFKVTVRGDEGTLIRNSVLAAAGAAAVRSHLPHAQDTVENCVLASSRNSQ